MADTCSRLWQRHAGHTLAGSCSRPSPHLTPALPHRRAARRGGTTTKAGADLAGFTSLVQGIAQAAAQPHPGWPTGIAVNTAVFTAGYKVLRKGLTPSGVAHAWFLGASVFSAFGPGGYLIVCLYFILGTLVTKMKLAQKQAEGIAEARSGQRGPASVWGSGIAGVACALAALATGSFPLWQVGFVASFASKLSDTVSSEVGKAYGRTTYLVTTFQLVPRGTEGAVSAEGTAAGVMAALLIAGLAWGLGQVSWEGCLIVAAAAVVANLFESYLGAVVQGRVVWLTNDLVNMIQISVAAGLALAAAAVLRA
ncbi:integral membrane protein DUF92-domain-containing protein [Haematococcus lacustris]